MSKDINIHLKTRGAGQTKQQLEDVGQAAKQVGDKTAEGHKEGAGAVDKTSQKMTRMGRVLGNLKSQVMSFVGAYLGLQAVRGVVTWLITKLEKIAQLQKEIYEKSLSFMEVGQALEMQTGTVGMQQDWAQQATKLQAAGGLRGPDVAQQMMISMDVALQRQGGIKAPQVMALAMQLAPFVGAQQMGPEEVAKLFEFAETAGIAPTTEAYGKYFAKIQAGYTASKATVFGQYMVGLQKGVTPFMAAGGTLEEGIAAYSAARKVTYNEMVAAQLLEQTARLASGAYKKPREAIEQGLGVRWDELSMNERYNALLQYAGGLPGARREQILAEQGFPAEITSKIGMLVTPGALTTLAETREKVQASTTALLDKQTQAYLDSVLGKERIADAEIALKGIKVAPEFADWQTRLENAEEEVKIRAARGKVREALHPEAHHIIAFEQLEKEAGELLKGLPEGPMREQTEKLLGDIRFSIGQLTEDPPWAKLSALGPRKGLKYTQRLVALLENASAEVEPGEGQHPVELIEAAPPSQPEETAPVPPISKEIEAPVPAEAEAAALPVNVPVEAVADKQPVEVPVDVEAAAMPFVVSAQPLERDRPQEQVPAVVHNHYHYDYGMHYYPRVGDSEIGPRIDPGAIV